MRAHCLVPPNVVKLRPLTPASRRRYSSLNVSGRSLRSAHPLLVMTTPGAEFTPHASC